MDAHTTWSEYRMRKNLHVLHSELGHSGCLGYKRAVIFGGSDEKRALGLFFLLLLSAVPLEQLRDAVEQLLGPHQL